MSREGLPAWYGGDRFRSHLEARWAIFFDQLEMKWEYEPQGFVVDGTPYLPDFAVFARLGTLWVEVKPSWDADPEGVEKFRKFAVWRPQPSRAVLLTFQWRSCPSGYHFDLAWPGKYRTKFVDDGCPDHFGGDGEERIKKAVAAALSHRFGKAA